VRGRGPPPLQYRAGRKRDPLRRGHPKPWSWSGSPPFVGERGPNWSDSSQEWGAQPSDFSGSGVLGSDGVGGMSLVRFPPASANRTSRKPAQPADSAGPLDVASTLPFTTTPLRGLGLVRVQGAPAFPGRETHAGWISTQRSHRFGASVTCARLRRGRARGSPELSVPRPANLHGFRVFCLSRKVKALKL
jgi:hypothetical protein